MNVCFWIFQPNFLIDFPCKSMSAWMSLISPAFGFIGIFRYRHQQWPNFHSLKKSHKGFVQKKIETYISQIPSAVRPSAPLALHPLAHQGGGALPSRLLHNCNLLQTSASDWFGGISTIMCLTLSRSYQYEIQYTYVPLIPFVAGLLSGEIWYWTLQYLSWQQLAASECTLESKANRTSYAQMRGTISDNECEASVRSSWIQKLMAMETASVNGNVSPQEKLTINSPKISQVPTELSFASSSGSSGTDSAFSSGTSFCSCWNNASRDSSHSQLEPYQANWSWTFFP